MKDSYVRKDPEFLFISLGRCGTSLFKHIIDKHSLLSLTDECHWLKGIDGLGLEFHKFIEIESLSVNCLPSNSRWWSGIRAMNRELFPLNSEEENWGIQFIGHSNLNALDAVYKIYPGIKTIVMHRDPRDLLHSFYRTGIGFPDFINDFNFIMEKVKQHSSQYLVSSYEELCVNSAETLTLICDFLEVNYEEDMLTPLFKATSHALYPALTPDGKVIGKSTCKWKREMSAAQLCSLVNDEFSHSYFPYSLLTERGQLVINANSDTEFEMEGATIIDRVNDGCFDVDIDTYGIIKIFGAESEKAVLTVNNKKYQAKYVSEIHLLYFDLREERDCIEKVEYAPHENGKKISSFLEIIEKLDDKKVWLYSCSSLTKRLIKNYRLEKSNVIKGILDCSPKSISFSMDDLQPLYQIHNPYVSAFDQEDIILITSHDHWSHASSLLVEQGALLENIYIVV